MVAHNTLRTCGRNQAFEAVVDVNNCLNHIKFPISLHACAPYFELPSYISNMEIAAILK